MPVTGRRKTFNIGDQVPASVLNGMQDDTILVSSEVGNPASLGTTAKSSMVAAINELLARIAATSYQVPYDWAMGYVGPTAVATAVDYLVIPRACTILSVQAMILGSLGSSLTEWDILKASVSAGSLGGFTSILATKPRVASGKRTSGETGGVLGVALGAGVSLVQGDVIRLDCLNASGAVGYALSIAAKAATI